MIKIIEGYNNYSISSTGEIRNEKFDRILKPSPNGDGYLSVHLFKDGKSKTCMVHRLVGLAFIDNPDDKPYINHIDSNRLNNHIENLEWVTSKENTEHCISVGRSSMMVSRSEWEEFQKWKKDQEL